MIILIFTPACILLGRIVLSCIYAINISSYLCPYRLLWPFLWHFFSKFSFQISFMQKRTLDDCNCYFIFMIVIMIIFMSPLSKGRHIDFVDFLILFIRVFRFHWKTLLLFYVFFLLFYVFFLFLAFLERYFSEIFDCFAPNFHDLWAL